MFKQKLPKQEYIDMSCCGLLLLRANQKRLLPTPVTSCGANACGTHRFAREKKERRSSPPHPSPSNSSTHLLGLAVEVLGLLGLKRATAETEVNASLSSGLGSEARTVIEEKSECIVRARRYWSGPRQRRSAAPAVASMLRRPPSRDATRSLHAGHSQASEDGEGLQCEGQRKGALGPDVAGN